MRHIAYSRPGIWRVRSAAGALGGRLRRPTWSRSPTRSDIDRFYSVGRLRRRPALDRLRGAAARPRDRRRPRSRRRRRSTPRASTGRPDMGKENVGNGAAAVGRATASYRSTWSARPAVDAGVHPPSRCCRAWGTLVSATLTAARSAARSASSSCSEIERFAVEAASGAGSTTIGRSSGTGGSIWPTSPLPLSLWHGAEDDSSRSRTANGSPRHVRAEAQFGRATGTSRYRLARTARSSTPCSSRGAPRAASDSGTARSDSLRPADAARAAGQARRGLVETLDGTMVFADVSGFTRLSERLARKGKEGAEYLVDAINACFSALLADAYARGGSLLKFGGDAMLLWFAGDEHVLRACASAGRDAPRRCVRWAGSAPGQATSILRMSVGVHSGSYAMFLVGGSHRELLIGGRGATTVVVEMEGLASAGQILLSADTAGRVAAGQPGRRRWGRACCSRARRRRPNGRRSDGCAHARGRRDRGLSAGDPVRARMLGDPRRARAPDGVGRVPPVHRTRRLIERARGPPAAATTARSAVRQSYRMRATATRSASSTRTSPPTARKIRLSAGAPRAVGRRRGADAACAARRSSRRSCRCPSRPGSIAVRCSPARSGPTYRRWYAVMGDTVNLAARLMGKAPAGPLYRDAGRAAARKTPVRARARSGRSRSRARRNPMQAWDVGPPTPRRFRGADTAERCRSSAGDASSSCSAARSTPPGEERAAMIELVGETGSGKVASAGRGARARLTACECCTRPVRSFTRDTPYSTWRDLLRQLLDVGWDGPNRARARRARETRSRARQPDLVPWLPLIAIVVDLDVPTTTEVEQLARREPRGQAARGRAAVPRPGACRPDDRRG